MVEEREKQFKYEFIIAAALCVICIVIFWIASPNTRILIVPMLLLLGFLIWKFFDVRDKIQQKLWINYNIAKIKTRKEKKTEEEKSQENQEPQSNSQ